LGSSGSKQGKSSVLRQRGQEQRHESKRQQQSKRQQSLASS